MKRNKGRKCKSRWKLEEWAKKAKIGAKAELLFILKRKRSVGCGWHVEWILTEPIHAHPSCCLSATGRDLICSYEMKKKKGREEKS